MHRFTSSAIYGRALGSEGQWATTLLYGANKSSLHSSFSSSALVESEAILDRSNTVFGRAEFVQKSAEDLVVDVPPFGFAPDREFDVGQISLGYIRELAAFRGATLGLGAMGTINITPSSLGAAYGSRPPLGGVVFLRVRPVFSRMRAMSNKMSMEQM
jgi:hypothetical protein